MIINKDESKFFEIWAINYEYDYDLVQFNRWYLKKINNLWLLQRNTLDLPIEF